MVRALSGVLLDCRHPGELVRRGIVRRQAQESLRSHADADSTQTHEEKIDGGEVADAETKRNAGKIAVAEEKDRGQSDSVGDAISECVCSSEEEKVFTEPDTGILSEQEEETKEFSHADSVPNRVASAFANSKRNP